MAHTFQPLRETGLWELGDAERFLVLVSKARSLNSAPLSEIAAPERKAVVLQMDVPLQPLKPGLYLCQVNIIDDVSGTFAFPRFPVLIREAQPPATTKAGN